MSSERLKFLELFCGCRAYVSLKQNITWVLCNMDSIDLISINC